VSTFKLFSPVRKIALRIVAISAVGLAALPVAGAGAASSIHPPYAISSLASANGHVWAAALLSGSNPSWKLVGLNETTGAVSYEITTPDAKNASTPISVVPVGSDIVVLEDRLLSARTVSGKNVVPNLATLSVYSQSSGALLWSHVCGTSDGLTWCSHVYASGNSIAASVYSWKSNGLTTNLYSLANGSKTASGTIQSVNIHATGLSLRESSDGNSVFYLYGLLGQPLTEWCTNFTGPNAVIPVAKALPGPLSNLAVGGGNLFTTQTLSSGASVLEMISATTGSVTTLSGANYQFPSQAEGGWSGGQVYASGNIALAYSSNTTHVSEINAKTGALLHVLNLGSGLSSSPSSVSIEGSTIFVATTSGVVAFDATSGAKLRTLAASAL